MKRFIVALSLVAISHCALGAEWKMVGGEAHLDDVTGTMMIGVGKGPDHRGFPMGIINRSPDCDGVKADDFFSGRPLTIGSTRVKIIATCSASGTMVLFPETAAGREFFLGQIKSNKDISITMPNGKVMVFRNRNGSDIVRKVFSLNDEPI